MRGYSQPFWPFFHFWSFFLQLLGLQVRVCIILIYFVFSLFWQQYSQEILNSHVYSSEKTDEFMWRSLTNSRFLRISSFIPLKKVQVRIHFDALYVRYLWQLVLPQYSPPESCPTLHNPLGLSQGLKSSLTSPQNGTKAAAIAMHFNPKMGIMHQSPSRRTRCAFYGIKMSDIESPQNSWKIFFCHMQLCGPLSGLFMPWVWISVTMMWSYQCHMHVFSSLVVFLCHARILAAFCRLFGAIMCTILCHLWS